MLDHLANARYHAYLAQFKLMRLNRLNLEDEQKKVAIGSIMADLRFSIKELERELATKK